MKSLFPKILNRRIFRRAAYGIAAVLILLTLTYVAENVRGKYAWHKFQAELKEKGELTTFQSIVSPIPPDELNFAATPLLKPLFDYTPSKSGTKWVDTNGLARVASIRSQEYDTTHKDCPTNGQWAKGDWGKMNFEKWQKFYCGNTNYTPFTPSQNPCEDVLKALSKFDGALSELRSASKRPYSVYPVHYAEADSCLLSHLANIKGIVILTSFRSEVLLDLNRSNEALNDTMLAFRMGDSVRTEPILISQLVRLATIHLASRSVWTGVMTHTWNDSQLVELQSYLEKYPVLENYSMAVNGERLILTDQVMARIIRNRELCWMNSNVPAPAQVAIKLIPSGWFYQNQVRCDRVLVKMAKIIDVQNECINTNAMTIATNSMRSVMASRTPYNVMARLLLPAFERCPDKFIRTDNVRKVTITACALERYRLANSQYPETLDSLIPKYLNKVPKDGYLGKPVGYSVKDGKFTLTAYGWNVGMPWNSDKKKK